MKFKFKDTLLSYALPIFTEFCLISLGAKSVIGIPLCSRLSSCFSFVFFFCFCRTAFRFAPTQNARPNLFAVQYGTVAPTHTHTHTHTHSHTHTHGGKTNDDYTDDNGHLEGQVGHVTKNNRRRPISGTAESLLFSPSSSLYNRMTHSSSATRPSLLSVARTGLVERLAFRRRSRAPRSWRLNLNLGPKLRRR